jgi:5'-phosphate synthase pdxT subunit
VEKILPTVSGIQEGEAMVEDTVVAPSKAIDEKIASTVKLVPVEIMGTLPGRVASVRDDKIKENLESNVGDIIAVRQANVFGTSFHPELTGDPRIHVWWLEQVVAAVDRRRNN